MSDSQLTSTIKALIEKGDKAREKAEQFYIAAGQHIKTLKEMSPSAAAWEKTLKEKCNLGKSRAYELLQIADGRTTVAKVRADKAASVKKLRHSPLRSGKSTSETDALMWTAGANVIGEHCEHRAPGSNGLYVLMPIPPMTIGSRRRGGKFGGYEIRHLPNAESPLHDGRYLGVTRTAGKAKARAQQDHNDGGDASAHEKPPETQPASAYLGTPEFLRPEPAAKQQEEPQPADNLDIPTFLRREAADKSEVVVTDAGKVVPAPADKPPAEDTPTKPSAGYTALLDAWHRASPEEQRRFLNFIGAQFSDAGSGTTKH